MVSAASGFSGYMDGDEVLERMRYWRTEGGKSLTASTQAAERFLLFDLDVGGLNNIRIGWEMAALVAKNTNRTLVLPPAERFYLIPGERSTIQDLEFRRR